MKRNTIGKKSTKHEPQRSERNEIPNWASKILNSPLTPTQIKSRCSRTKYRLNLPRLKSKYIILNNSLSSSGLSHLARLHSSRNYKGDPRVVGFISSSSNRVIDRSVYDAADLLRKVSHARTRKKISISKVCGHLRAAYRRSMEGRAVYGSFRVYAGEPDPFFPRVFSPRSRACPRPRAEYVRGSPFPRVTNGWRDFNLKQTSWHRRAALRRYLSDARVFLLAANSRGLHVHRVPHTIPSFLYVRHVRKIGDNEISTALAFMGNSMFCLFN